MISYSGKITKLDYKINDYQEGPWFYKRNGHYYLTFASTCCPEGIGYAMSDSPTGPWEYKGHIMNHTDRTRGNHPGIIDYKGQSWVFGLNYDILRISTPKHHERRSVSVAPMHYNIDGTIQEVPYFKDTKLEAVDVFDPYQKVEAETMAWGYGLKTFEEHKDGKTFIALRDIDDGETLLLKNVNLGAGANSFTATTASMYKGGTIEILANGIRIGKLKVPQTGSTEKYATSTCKLKNNAGICNLTFVFKGKKVKKDMFRFDAWEMK
jgi:hypothetical protein